MMPLFDKMWFALDGDTVVGPLTFSEFQLQTIGLESDGAEWWRRVAEDVVEGWTISTVFLTLDHSFGHGPPLVFETMVFPEGSYSELYCDRYSTKAEALAGHKAVVEGLKNRTLEGFDFTPKGQLFAVEVEL